MKKTQKNLIIYIILIIIAILISFKSYISPTNTTGYIATDVSVWTSIAKKMSHGEIMYRDFFDHKGPILYFLYYLGYLFGKNLGIWIIDVICNIINVLMIYKISDLVLKNKGKSLIVVLICMCFICKICEENPCTESLSLPFILISFYQFTKFSFNMKGFGYKESLCTGICFAIVLLLRPNIATLWIVYYIYIFIKLLKEKETKRLLKIIGTSALGIIIIFLPTILYLIKNMAFGDFIDTYLLFNFKYMSNKESSIIEVIINYIRYTNYIIILIGDLYIILICLKRKFDKREYELLNLSFIYFIFTFYTVIIPQRIYAHYLISMLPTIIIPLAMFFKNIKTNKKTDIIIIIQIFFIYLILLIGNREKELDKKYSYITACREVSNKVQELTKKDDNVLVLGNCTIIYLMSDREYEGKYLYQLPIANQNEDIANEVIKEINNNLPDLIVNAIKHLNENNNTKFENEIKTVLKENYITKDEIIYVKK